VRDAVLADEAQDLRRIHLAQHDVAAAYGRDGPREAPAVAVEQRQRPQVHRIAFEAVDDDLAERVQVRAAEVYWTPFGRPVVPDV
jgi:hypothetical protein